jgi:hypothetical protein
MNIQQIIADHQLWLNNQGGLRADLSWANLSEANLSGANLSGANLRDANLSEANLSDANLRGANLSEANLREANLSGADLSEANLSWADLSEANLSGADLSGADLSGANLSGADLSGANLQESRGLTYAQCAWSGHGEKGRQLLAIKTGAITLFCGCFRGTPNDLKQYIETSDQIYAKSRTKAMEFVLSCLES